MLVILGARHRLCRSLQSALCGMIARSSIVAWPEAGIAPVLRAHAGFRCPCWAHSTACWSGNLRLHAHRGDRSAPCPSIAALSTCCQGRVGQRERDVARLPGVSAQPNSWGSSAALVAGAGQSAAWPLRDRRCAVHARGARPTRAGAGSRGGKLLRPGIDAGAHAVHQRTRSAARSPAICGTCGVGAFRAVAYTDDTRSASNTGHRRLSH